VPLDLADPIRISRTWIARLAGLCDRDRCLRYRLPELRVVAEKDARTALFQRF